jgi:hypothetical protein
MAVAVSLNPADCDLKVTTAPVITQPRSDGTNMTFPGTEIRLGGFVTLTRAPGDSVQGWTGRIPAGRVDRNQLVRLSRADYRMPGGRRVSRGLRGS